MLDKIDNLDLGLDARNKINLAFDTIDALMLASASSSGYSSIEDEGTPLTNRSTLNFVGAGVSVADSGSKTVVTITTPSVWGGITGTLSNQTDLQTALNTKEPLKGSDDNYVTDAQLVVIGNTSGTNTGDQNRASLGIDAGTIIVTSGTSFTTPSNITTSTIFYIELVGGGGGGGGRSTTNLSGSGGGGGGYCFVKLTGLSPSTTYTCAIGAGGAGGADASNGVDGGSTTLTIGATTYTASGGIKGVKTNSSNGGAGGTGTNGDINMEGQRGWASVAVASTAILAAQGGNSPKSWGNGGAAKYSDGAGVGDGTGYGGGGASSKFGAGANGSSGIIYAQYIN